MRLFFYYFFVVDVIVTEEMLFLYFLYLTEQDVKCVCVFCVRFLTKIENLEQRKQIAKSWKMMCKTVIISVIISALDRRKIQNSENRKKVFEMKLFLQQKNVQNKQYQSINI